VSMRITICGGGNAAHVLAGLLAARPQITVNVYAPYGDEAERWRAAMARTGGMKVITPQGTYIGRPAQVSADAAEVIPGARLILLALPALAHHTVLRDIAPFAVRGAWVGAMPARGGFLWDAAATLGARRRDLVLFGLQTLPWACRIREYGREVEVLGTKAAVDMATWPADDRHPVSAILTRILGVRVTPVASFLGLTLADVGQLIHPGVMYGLFHDWDGQPYAEAPLFYQGIDDETAGLLQRLSDEVQGVRRAVEKSAPWVDLSAVRPLREWLQRSYGGSITDASSLRTCFVTNRSYAGLRAPMRAVDGGLGPDFGARYLAEDVPFGLVVTRGIAEVAGVRTPAMDRVITWAQERLGKEFLVEGTLRGQDIDATRAPQRYGYGTVEDLLRSPT